MEKIIIQGKTIEFENESKRKNVENILDTYLHKKEQSLEQKIIESVEKHKINPRAFGESFRELIASTPDGEIESVMQAGIRVSVLLDRLAFPSQRPTDPAIEGWPPQRYFPDGFSFLSYNRDTERDSTNDSEKKSGLINLLYSMHCLKKNLFLFLKK